MEPRNRCQGINSASLSSLAGQYENPIPPQCLAPIDFLKIPALQKILTKGVMTHEHGFLAIIFLWARKTFNFEFMSMRAKVLKSIATLREKYKYFS
jgi:hypothetical protein